MRLGNIIIVTLCVTAAVLVLGWIIVIPESLLREGIEQGASRPDNGIVVSLKGLRKGIFFTVSADKIVVTLQNSPALYVEDVSAAPLVSSLKKLDLIYGLSGTVGGGEMTGEISAGGDGFLKIEGASLSEIPAVNRFGLGIDGTLSADISFDRDGADVRFRVPDLELGDETLQALPFLSSFRSIQGAASVSGDTIKFDSVSLDGEKGHARLKGRLINGRSDLKLEVMPDRDKLTPLESMMIGKYIVSPGYYVIPLRGSW